ncbi:hypothetical protein Goari_025192 [Gossypium aridum]|uniref:Peptidase A2 domain-containing protein n=1 Tax=Gossypium aridum TaxID=34290 RepID=A0A7J8X8F7_GOSAI|nr:hypothetical protein [Gossypium aridum]
MVKAKSFVELGPKKNKFKSSKPNETDNSRGDHEEKGQVKNCNEVNDKTSGNRKPHNGKWKPNNKLNRPMKCFLCDGPHMKGFMYVDINIAGQRKSAFVDTGASDLFISKKVVGKLNLLVIKATKKIKMVNFNEFPIVGVAQGVEQQIGPWKGKDDFSVIHLDDYNFVLGLNFLEKINALLVPLHDPICILDT